MTVSDSIEKVTFVDDALESGGKEPVNFSPDGRYFFIITKRGVLKTGQLESAIWLFDTAVVSSALKRSSNGNTPVGRPLITMATSSNGDPITRARWTTDSEHIVFLGRDNEYERHLYTLSVKTGTLEQLTPNGQDVMGFDYAKDTLVLTTVPSVVEAQLYQSAGPTLPDIQLGTGLSLFDLLYPQWEKFTFGLEPLWVWQVRDGKASPVVDSATSSAMSVMSPSVPAVLSLSPSGRYAVVTDTAARVPPTWQSYEAAYRFTRIVADRPNTKPAMDAFRPLQYKLIDLQGGKTSVLIDAPLGASAGFQDASIVLWSRNEREVILTNTFLPLEGNDAVGRPRSTRPWVAAVDIESGKIAGITEVSSLNKDGQSRPRLSSLQWRAGDQQLVLRYFDDSAETTLEPRLFERRGGRWEAVTDRAAIDAVARTPQIRGLAIAVRQSINEPPVLIATDMQTGGSKRILDPNPQFAKIKFGQARVYKWHDKGGHQWIGGLVQPPDYVEGHRYPLVIQSHGFNPQEFLIDGSFSTAMAARPMAGRGMVVLQIGGIGLSPAVVGTPQESRAIREGYLAAIEQLDTDRLIDPRKVGIIGFSRTGWYVLDALINARKYFAAGTLAECTYESFGEYMLNADYLWPGRAKSIAAAIGTEPFGAGLQKWLSNSPGFNTDKIDAPILFEANSPVGMIYEWDMYAAMRLQNKPVELLYFRNGEHVLTKPLERLASQEMTVDWYDFWLNEHEDPAPAKANQYKRWHELKEMQQVQETARGAALH